jgi:hypothetical protein
MLGFDKKSTKSRKSPNGQWPCWRFDLSEVVSSNRGQWLVLLERTEVEDEVD